MLLFSVTAHLLVAKKGIQIKKNVMHDRLEAEYGDTGIIWIIKILCLGIWETQRKGER